jgi:hypothetical protein
MVDHGLATPAAVPWSGADARHRRDNDSRRRAWVVDAFARFALQGLGTPAPIAPPRNLVVTGLYRYVRNPIYVALVAIILGQAVLMGDWRLIVYGALWWLVFHVAVVAYEEPTLEQTFGKEYEAFRAAVPRWIPRMTPWRSGMTNGSMLIDRLRSFQG